MLIIAFKLLITPILIGLVTLAGRRWGAALSGMLIGLPLTSGPISFILACEFGLDFASQAAVGGLAGQISNCLFCLTYIAVSRKHNWLLSSICATSAFIGATLVWDRVPWELWPAFFSLLCAIFITGALVPARAIKRIVTETPTWDLPARILIATGFVVALTTTARVLGPHLSGLIAPFPAFILIFSAFTHAQQGPDGASNLLRSVVLGSGAYASFFLTVGALLPKLGILATYTLATVAAITIGSISFRISSRISKRATR